MLNMFVPEVSAQIIARIQNLSAGSKPVWGKMNVNQMMAHCIVPMEVALNDKKLKRSIVGLLFGSMTKKKFLSEAPISKNLPTDNSFRITDERDFTIERSRLIAIISRFTSGGPDALTKGVHPFFGKMTAEEWGMLCYKHLDHHLRQFGV